MNIKNARLLFWGMAISFGLCVSVCVALPVFVRQFVVPKTVFQGDALYSSAPKNEGLVVWEKQHQESVRRSYAS